MTAPTTTGTGTAVGPRNVFDLRTEPWVPVRRLDGGAEELSLLDVVRRAHELREVVGELPTTAFALVRLLLALLHSSVEVLREGTDEREGPRAAWKALWESPTLPADAVADYLDEHAARFDLLHAVTPFFQVAGLTTAKGEVSGLERLVADVPNGLPFFTTRAGEQLRRVSYAEGARWLVHAQAFDPSGIKSGAVGDPRVKGGKGYPIGTAWAGQLGGLLVEGATLRETLLLNLVLAEMADQPFPGHDLPVWERPPLSSTIEKGHPAPVGPADLFTWPSRRVRLAHDGAGVTGVVLSNGDPLEPQNRLLEPMTAWRRSEFQEKKRGEHRVYMPRTHVPERSLWRGLAALLPQGEREVQRRDGSRVLPPRTLEWLRELQGEGVLARDHVVRTRAVGIEYGAQSSTVSEIVDDALSVRLVLVAESGRDLREAALTAVAGTEQAVRALAACAADLAEAGGGDRESAESRALEDGYFILDAPFRSWLAGLHGGLDPTAALHHWSWIARGRLRALGDELVEAAGPAAWTGRANRQGRHLSTPEADLRLRSALRRALPLPSDPEPTTPRHARGDEAAGGSTQDRTTDSSTDDREDGA